MINDSLDITSMPGFQAITIEHLSRTFYYIIICIAISESVRHNEIDNIC